MKSWKLGPKSVVLVVVTGAVTLAGCGAGGEADVTTTAACDGGVVRTVEAERPTQILGTDAVIPEGERAEMIRSEGRRTLVRYGTTVGWVDSRDAPGPVLAPCNGYALTF